MKLMISFVRQQLSVRLYNAKKTMVFMVVMIRIINGRTTGRQFGGCDRT
jgi:hypothetical protein